MSFLNPTQPARAPLTISLVLSVLLHLLGVGGVAGVFAFHALAARLAPWLEAPADPAPVNKPADPDQATPDPLPPVVWVRPGIDASSADSDVWIGYDSETDHIAFASSIDQSAMTPDMPGMRGDADLGAPPSPPGTPAPEAIRQQDPLEPPAPQPEAPVPTPAPPSESPAKLPSTPPPLPPPPREVIIAPETRAVPDDVRDGGPEEHPPAQTTKPDQPPQDAPSPPKPEDSKPEDPKPDPANPDAAPPADEPPAVEPVTPEPPPSEEPADPTPKPAPPASPPSPQPAPSPAPGANPQPAPAGDPGEQSDKEADATSIKQAVDYRNGRVKAGEGLDIRTVKPEFSNYTVLTALPRVPVVEITFNTKGRVKNVRIVQSSGYKDVDEPILNAVWAWSAKGKQLEALARKDPKAVLKISVRMLL